MNKGWQKQVVIEDISNNRNEPRTSAEMESEGNMRRHNFRSGRGQTVLRNRTLVCLLAGALVVAACGNGEGVSTTSSLETTTTEEVDEGGSDIPATALSDISAAYDIQAPAALAPWFVALERGFLSDVGIESFEITEVNDPIPAVLSGRLDMPLLNTASAFSAAHESGEALKILAAPLGGNPLILGGAPGIETPEDLKGKRVGAAFEGSDLEANTREILTELGLDPDEDVELVNLGGSSQGWVQQMLTGDLAATLMFTRHKPIVEEAGGTVLFSEIRQLPQSVFALTQSKIDENPELPAAFFHAWIRAVEFVKDVDNQERVAEILEANGVAVPEYFFDIYADDAKLLTWDLGWDPADMDGLMEDAATFGDVDPDIPWRNYVDVSHLHEAQAALDLPLNPTADLQEGQTKISLDD